MRWADIPTPDPRQPIGAVKSRLWTYGGNAAVQAIEPPKPSISDMVQSIAERPYHVHNWHLLAEQAAAALGVEARDGLLGAMVHPPKPAKGIAAWDWVLAGANRPPP